MANARDINPARDGMVSDFIGPPGSGKSTLAKSALELGKGFAFFAPEGEVMGYAGLDLEYEALRDPEWDPTVNCTKVNAYPAMMAALRELEKRDDVKVLIFDTASAGPSEAIWRAVLSSLGNTNPQKLNNPFAPYMVYPIWMAAWLDRLDFLRFKRKLHVIKLWHGQMNEVEGLGAGRREVQDGKVVTRWDEAMMPEVKGRVLPPTITKWSDLAFYTEAVLGSKPFKCRMTVMPESKYMAKTRLSGLIPQLQTMAEVPNNYPALVEMVAKAATMKK